MSLLRELFNDLMRSKGRAEVESHKPKANPGAAIAARKRIERQKAITEYVSKHPGATVQEIAKHMEMEDSTVRKHLRRMRADNILFTDGAVGQAPKYFVRKK